MAKTDKKISINAYERAMEENFEQSETVEWAGLEIRINRHISVQEMLAFVENVVSSAFDKDGNYVPEAFDFSIRLNIMCRYANFVMPKNVAKQYEFAYGTDVVPVIVSHINKDQLNAIVHAAESKIKYICDTNVSAVQRELLKVTDAFGELQESTEDVFKNINSDDLSKLVSALAKNGALDEEKVVKALLDRKYGEPAAEGTGEATDDE